MPCGGWVVDAGAAMPALHDLSLLQQRKSWIPALAGNGVGADCALLDAPISRRCLVLSATPRSAGVSDCSMGDRAGHRWVICCTLAGSSAGTSARRRRHQHECPFADSLSGRGLQHLQGNAGIGASSRAQSAPTPFPARAVSTTSFAATKTSSGELGRRSRVNNPPAARHDIPGTPPSPNGPPPGSPPMGAAARPAPPTQGSARATADPQTSRWVALVGPYGSGKSALFEHADGRRRRTGEAGPRSATDPGTTELRLGIAVSRRQTGRSSPTARLDGNAGSPPR